jgi:mycothiol synthase
MEINLPLPKDFYASDQIIDLTWRPAQPDDAVALNRLLLDIESTDHRGWVDTLEDRQNDFKDPDTNAATDSLLAITPQGIVAAMAWVFTPPPTSTEHLSFLWGEVHPEFRRHGLGSFIINWMEARGRQILADRPNDLPHIFRTNTPDNLPDRVSLLEKNGYHVVRVFYRMRRDLAEPIPEWTLPASVRMIPWRLDLEDQAMDAFNASFSDHWGFIPIQQDQWNLWLVKHADFRPNLSFLTLAPDESGAERVIGFSINQVHEAANQAEGITQGWVRDLGVIRAYRRQGVATALLCASMQAFKDAGMQYAGLGVDSENLTGALRIYERVGFKVTQHSLAYAKRVNYEA